MSYRRPNTGDSLNDYFSALSDFVQLWPNLVNASTEQGFLCWFEKLYLIDPRSLVIWLERYRDDINPKFWWYVEYRLGKYLN